MRSPFKTGRQRTLARRTTIAMASVATVAAALAVGMSPASAQGHANSPSTSTDTYVKTKRTDDRLPAPERPKATRPTERVVTLAAAAAPASTGVSSGTGTPGSNSKGRTLVLYDTTGSWGWLGEVYAEQTANLVSHFNAWSAHPVSAYTAGELNGYTSVVYVGSTYDEPLPTAFLDDVTATTLPVTWIYDNIWQLTARDPNFATRRGFTWKQFDFAAVSRVDYKGTSLTRDTTDQSGIMDDVIYDATKATVLATAYRPDGTTFPWAVRAGNFTYVGEIPYSYVTHDDRYIAFSDLLFDSVGSAAQAGLNRHRALVRIEDVGPDADPAELTKVADYLYAQKVPFSVAVYPRYRDPNGVVSKATRDRDYTLADKPKVVTALKYMQSHGGTLLMHGYTHQYSNVANPYDAVSANDFEFYRAHIDAANNVIYDGPVAEDSTSWANDRIQSAASAFTKAGLSVPTVFEFPHYAGSATDYRAVTSQVGTRYDRGLYFPGVLTGAAIDYTQPVGQFFPYAVRDVYGANVIPENIGNVEPEWYNNHPPRLPADILASAKRNLAVRDGMASFFYHPYLGTSYLTQIVSGLKSQGYSFVAGQSVLAN